MRLSSRRGRQGERLSPAGGVVRLDRRTKTLTKRLRPGDVAVIDHADLDRVSADALVGCRVSAVVNAARSTTGRYPNLGPGILLAAGIPLLDGVGQDVFAAVREGEQVRLDGAQLCNGDRTVAAGVLQTAESVEAAMAEARLGLAEQLEAFAANTMEYMLKERDLLFDGVGVPVVMTDLQGRHALIVVRGYDYKQDLAVLRPYIREYKPVLIGVDGGADALVEAGYKPDMVVGDMDSVSDAAPRTSCTPTPTAARPACAGCRTSASRRSPSRRPAPARTWRCCSPTRRAPRSSSRWAPTRRSWSSSTRAARACPARSSRGCVSAASSSTPRA